MEGIRSVEEQMRIEVEAKMMRDLVRDLKKKVATMTPKDLSVCYQSMMKSNY